MATMDHIISYRYQHGLKTQKFNANNSDLIDLARDDSGPCRCLAFSGNGEYFAHCNSSAVKVRKFSGGSAAFELEHPKAAHMTFSPCGSVLAVWEQFATTADKPQGSPNLNLYSTDSGQLLKGFVCKKSDSWCPSWLEDDSVCSRFVPGEVHFYQDGDFSKMQCRLSLAGLASYSMATSKANPHVAAYIPGKRGQPSSVRVFSYPNFSAPVTNKSFYKAEKVTFHWNSRGTDLVLLTACDVAQDSYYGEQGLHFLSVKGESCVVPLQKQGPIYHIEWHPSSTEFVVTAGSMPAKTTVYNLRCEPVFDFGTGPRNLTYFNSFGNIICLAGFGNLKGDVEMWDYKNKKIMSKFVASDTTQFEWCSDGEHFLAAVTSPRLRVNNGLTVWHYSGRQVVRKEFECLLEAVWRPDPSCTQQPTLHYDASRSYQSVAQQAQPTRYVPPHMRNKSAAAAAPAKSQLRPDYELPSNQRPDSSQPMSKSAIKNQKKKERKKAAAAAAPEGDEQQQQQPGQQQSTAGFDFQSTNDPEKDKKIKNIMRKLNQIDKLKAERNEGKVLEKNQIEKLATEASLRDELSKLYL